MSAGGRLCTLQANPHFWVPTIEVRLPDGIIRSYGSLNVARVIFVRLFACAGAAPPVVYDDEFSTTTDCTVCPYLLQKVPSYTVVFLKSSRLKE
jgi:hypothetical protein